MAARSVVFLTELPRDHHPGHLDHAAIAVALRRHPGLWGLVAAPATRNAAYEAARRIRLGLNRAYRPRRAFDARAVTTETGVHQVWARYEGAAR